MMISAFGMMLLFSSNQAILTLGMFLILHLDSFTISFFGLASFLESPSVYTPPQYL